MSNTFRMNVEVTGLTHDEAQELARRMARKLAAVVSEEAVRLGRTNLTQQLHKQRGFDWDLKMEAVS